MTRLFCHADPSMPEEKMFRVLMREVKQELFVGLIQNPPKYVQEFLLETTSIEKTPEIRTCQYNALMMQGSPDLHALGSHDLREAITSDRERGTAEDVTLIPCSRKWTSSPTSFGKKSNNVSTPLNHDSHSCKP